MSKKKDKIKETTERTKKPSWRERVKARAEKVKKFPPYYKGYLYKAYLKGIYIYIDVARMDNRGKKTTFKIVGDELQLVSTTMPQRMHLEYQKVLSKNIAGIVNNLKWHEILRYRLTGILRRIKK